MKTIIKFLLSIACVFLYFACSKSNDDPVANGSQSSVKNINAKGTGSDVYQFFVDWPSTIPVVCGGETVDYLVSQNFYVMTVDHFKNGNFVWEITGSPHIVYVSQNTGESFETTAFKQKNSGDLFYIWFNFLGKNGSHYIGHITADFNGTVLEAKSKCL